MSDTIRIKTTPNGSDKYLNVKIEQDFDFIQVLSLKITQDNVYQNFCADYGVVVGRVVINSGFGVPNVKVSIFIPLDDTDSTDPIISGLYPYTTVNDKNSDGIRYNLLPSISDSQDPCYTTVGTFPTKREILDNDDMLYVYKKYYQFTSITNYAGDFMIFGVPLGNHTVHVDMDISNIGIASQRPYDLISQGAPPSMFYSPTKFKANTNLNSLPQIKTANASVNVQPFWGDQNNCQIGINRLDFDMNYNITPAAIFMGGIFGDHEKNSVDKRCIPRKKMGIMCQQETGPGMIEMIRKTQENQIESFDVNGGQVIDNNGAWAYQIPMNLDYVVTAEDGSLIPSSDPNIGIPTRSRVRFRISMNESGDLGRLRTRANYLVPNNPASYNELDLNFDQTTKDSSFTDLYWNKIYTVKNFIPKYYRNNENRFLGIKDTDKCESNNLFPYNNYSTYKIGFNFILFSIICLISKYVTFLVATVNSSLGIFLVIQNIFNTILCPHFLGITPWCLTNIDIVPVIKLKCDIDDNSSGYAPTLFDYVNGKANDWSNCIAVGMATNFDVYQMDFYNDWINGALYSYLLKYKHKNNGRNKYCDANCVNDSNPCVDGTISYSIPNGTSEPINSSEIINQGLIIADTNNTLYYSPITTTGRKLFATDMTNLGAIFNCDWQSFPKIINYLSPTSYKIPPIIVDSNFDYVNIVKTYTSGMFSTDSGTGLFFKVDCGGVSPIDDFSQINMKRISEFGVDIPESTATTITQLSINQIYDLTEPPQASIHKYIRDSYTLLNINGSGISTFPTNLISSLSAPSDGTSFGVDANPYINGGLYSKYANYNNLLGGSYYMYFGLVKGKTAYDKLKSNFLTACPPNINDNFDIRVDIYPSSTPTASDGGFNFSFVGGTPPFSTIIVGPNVPNNTYISTTQSQTQSVSGLIDGQYEIVATDSLGTVVTRKVIISGPQRLTMYYSVFNNPSTSTSNDGIVLIDYLSGGTEPYTISLTNTKTNQSFTPTTNLQGGKFTNLNVGTYVLKVVDKSSPKQSETVNFELTAPPPLTVILSKTDSSATSCVPSGSIVPNINGGKAPYILSATSTDGYLSGGSSDVIYSFNDLYAGDYTVTVKDSVGTIVTENITINGSKQMKFIGDVQTKTIGGNKTNAQITVIKYIAENNLVTGGVPNYILSAKGETRTPTYTWNISPYALNNLNGIFGWENIPTDGSFTLTATDTNGCTVTKTFY